MKREVQSGKTLDVGIQEKSIGIRSNVHCTEAELLDVIGTKLTSTNGFLF
jgi:hypothetical protein